MGAIDNQIDLLLKSTLSEQSLEEFLEDYDLTPTEVIAILYRGGHIDLTEQLEELEV